MGAGNMELMDPIVLKKGIEIIKEEMREMQREAHLIESDLEKRLQGITTRQQ